MNAPALTLRLALATACGLLLLGGIAGAAIVDDDTGTTSVEGGSGPEATTTTIASGAAAAGEPVAPAPGSPAPDAATTGTTAAVGTTLPGGAAGAGAAATTSTTVRRRGSAAPGPLTPPKPGEYAYEATTASAGGTRTERAVTNVESAGSEGATTIQAVTIGLDLGGQQASARNTVAWDASGATVRRSVITVMVMGQQQLDCTWQPPFLQYAGGLAVGKTWTFATRCVGKVQGIDVTIEQRATRRVTGSATVAGPAGSLATWTIADDTTLQLTSPLGTGTVHTVGTQQLAPSFGLPVTTSSKVEARMAGGAPETSTVTTKLLSLP